MITKLLQGIHLDSCPCIKSQLESVLSDFEFDEAKGLGISRRALASLEDELSSTNFDGCFNSNGLSILSRPSEAVVEVYSKGFKRGYEMFESELTRKAFGIPNDNSIAQILFATVNGKLEFFQRFPFTESDRRRSLNLVQVESFGEQAGTYIHAWDTIVNNGQRFLSPFEEAFSPKSLIEWHGTEIELLEIVKAIHLTGRVKGTQKDVYPPLLSVFGIEVDQKSLGKRLNELKKRKSGNETKFLNLLKETLENDLNQ